MTPTASIIIIGNEILSGRTQDKNLHWLAGELNSMGIKVAEASVVSDIEQEIIATLNRHRTRYDYVFTSGGIGPTHDDITSATVARAFGIELEQNPQAAQALSDYYGTTELSAARMKMAEIPQGAALIANPVSGAPGFKIENVYVMAGVPSIFKAMFGGLRHQLVGGDPILSVSTTTFIAESFIALELGELQLQYPQLDIGSYPFARDGAIGTRLVISGTETSLLQQAQEKLYTLLDNKKAAYQLDDTPPS